MASDQLGFTFTMPERRIWSVRELVASVRTTLEREYTDVWVEGEISNFRPADSGHLYFSLKDDAAQLRIVMFRTQARLLRFRPENGLRIIARGQITLYEGRGELQLLAEFLEPQGAGALQVAFEQLKTKLQAEGLFDRSRKKAIPALPKSIGVVTSPRGAVIQDILNVLRRRHRGVNVLIYPAQVQGEAAPSEVAAGLRHFNRAGNVEVIIVARGGGSLEDLAAFNNEGLARTIAASGIPVISAIGHETDFTICDFVADLRAPTPSAAAELAIRSRQELEEQLSSLRQHLVRAMRLRLLEQERLLSRLARHDAFQRMKTALMRRQQRLDELWSRLIAEQTTHLHRLRHRLAVADVRLRSQHLETRVTARRQQLESYMEKLGSSFRRALMHRRSLLGRLEGQLQGLSPTSILERGYALVFDDRGRLLKDALQTAEGNEIHARLARGTISATVRKRE